MKAFVLPRPFFLVLWLIALLIPVHAQLAITEAMSSASTNLGPNEVVQNSDYWELTNFGTNSIDLTGFRFDDSDSNLAAADSALFQGLTIAAGESILFVQDNVNTNEISVRNWWGTNLPAGVRIVLYTGNGFSSAGDGIRLWNAEATDPADLVDSVDFGEAIRGVSFAYDPNTGAFGVLSTNSTSGNFKAATSDDLGSPGRTTGPTPLQIVQQPTNTIVNPGDTARFTIGVEGRPRGRTQWLFQGNVIPGANKAVLEITNAQAGNTGSYQAVIDNGVQIITSNPAELVLQSEAAAPVITVAPTDLTISIGQSYTFHAVATGLPQPSFEWQIDGRALSAEVPGEFRLINAAETDSGLYSVIARNGVGAATNSFHVTVTPNPQLIVTEVMSSSATNVIGHGDWWELSNPGTFPVDLRGYRFDDNSETLGSAFTFTNAVTIAPGESVIFVEEMSPEAFRQWWGAENLPANLQIVPYQGNGLSSAGDAINVWNAAASEDSDKVTSAVFSSATAGFSFIYNPDTSQFGDLSVLGVLGAVSAQSGGDIGSPGFIRATPRVTAPRFEEIQAQAGAIRLTWTTQAGTNYVLEAKTQLSDSAWTRVTNVIAAAASTTIEDLVSEPSDQRFYRVVAGP